MVDRFRSMHEISGLALVWSGILTGLFGMVTLVGIVILLGLLQTLIGGYSFGRMPAWRVGAAIGSLISLWLGSSLLSGHASVFDVTFTTGTVGMLFGIFILLGGVVSFVAIARSTVAPD